MKLDHPRTTTGRRQDMIPDYLVDEANYAYMMSKNRQAIEADFKVPLWSRKIPTPPNSKTSMRHALEAVVADIWNEGYEAGSGDEWEAERGKTTKTPNPYAPEATGIRTGTRASSPKHWTWASP